MNPTFSVIVPAFNAASYIRETLESVARQTVPVAELIVVDDGSDDNTEETVRQWMTGKNMHCRIFQQRNKGPGAARNVGARNSSGQWLCFLDSDDVYDDRAIECFMDGIRSFPSARWIGADIATANADLSEVYLPSFRERPRAYEILRAAFMSNAPILLRCPWEHFLKVCLTANGAVAVRRDAFWEIGGYRCELRMAEDYDLWIRAAMLEDFVFVPRRTCWYRMRESSLMHSDSPPRLWTKIVFRDLDKLYNLRQKSDVLESRLSEFEREDAQFYLEKHHVERALACAVKAIWLRPWCRANWVFLSRIMGRIGRIRVRRDAASSKES